MTGHIGENQILFVVRDDEGNSQMLFQTSDTTWEAYNDWGGSSLYTPNYPNGRALAVSYGRPFANRDDNPLNYFWGEEYAMIRFMERNGYDVSYASGVDTCQVWFQSAGPQSFHVGRPRRILVGRTAGQCRSRPRCRRQSGVLQRQRSVLEDPLDRRQCGRSVHHDGRLQGDIGRRQDRSLK